MPRNYKRKTNRQSWSQESMRKAIEAWKQKKMGWELAAKTFGVPQATLRRHALKLNKTLNSSSKGLGIFKQTFSTEIEQELVDHVKFLETRLFGLTRTSLQELAFGLAEKNGFDHPFNKDKRRAGQEWLEGFLRRNKDISLRAPERLRASRQRSSTLIYDSSGSEDFLYVPEDDDSDCACIYCNDLFSRSKPGEGWLQCMTCFLWAHASCADVSKKTKRFVCELCS